MTKLPLPKMSPTCRQAPAAAACGAQFARDELPTQLATVRSSPASRKRKVNGRLAVDHIVRRLV